MRGARPEVTATDRAVGTSSDSALNDTETLISRIMFRGNARARSLVRRSDWLIRDLLVPE